MLVPQIREIGKFCFVLLVLVSLQDSVATILKCFIFSQICRFGSKQDIYCDFTTGVGTVLLQICFG